MSHSWKWAALEENSVDVQVEISGIHRLVFTNPARIQGLIGPREVRHQPLDFFRLIAQPGKE